MANLTHLFRAWGLQSLNFLVYDQSKPEGPKYVLRKSFWIAMSRCVVHLFPVGFCIFLACLSFVNIYIGPGFSVSDASDRAYFIGYQIAAKLLELLSIGSMTAVLLYVLRQDLLHGDGVPLGLLTSHLQCSQPQSVLSPEYLSAAQTIIRDLFRTLGQIFRGRWMGFEVIRWHLRRIRLFALVSFAVLGASLIGPFSAVLLIPRAQYFSAGGTSYNLNATSAELWPEMVTSDLEPEICHSENATQYPVCPSGGYLSARNSWSLSTIYDADSFRPSVDGQVGSYAGYSVIDPWGIFPQMEGMGNDRKGPLGGYMPTIFAQANSYTAVMVQTLLRDWIVAAREAQQDKTHRMSLRSSRNFIHAEVQGRVVSRHPITCARCSIPQNLSASADFFEFHRFQPNARFVAADEESWGSENNTAPVNISSLHRDPMSHLRTQWVDLPADLFGPLSTGLLFEMPWSATNTSRITIGCTVIAAWCTSQLSYGIYAIAPDLVDCEGKPTKILRDDEDVVWQAYNRRIGLERSWLDLLTPKAPASSVAYNDWQPSTLDMIFEAAGFDTLMQDLRQHQYYIPTNNTCGIGYLDPTLTDLELWNKGVCSQADKVAFIERTLARLVTDGLSRRLSHRAFDMLPNLRSWIVTGPPRTENYNKKLIDPERRENAVEMSSDQTRLTQTLYVDVFGYGYAASTTTDRIAIAVVFTYVGISVLFVAWTMIRRISSSSWESPLELMILAWNSPQLAALQGTSAQIRRWRTYRLVARVIATATAASSESNTTQMHLQLLLEDPPVAGGASGLPKPGHSIGGQHTLANPQTEQIEVDKKYY